MPEVDEQVEDAETPERYLERIVLSKRQAIERNLLQEVYDGALVADTTVVCDGVIMGKPGDRAEALRMLADLSGRTHRVLTAYSLWTKDGQERQRVVETLVTFRSLSEPELAAYLDCGESLDKAGGYGIQGRALAFVDGVRGSYSNVVGLPLSQVISDLLKMRLVDPSQLFGKVGLK